MSGPGAGNPGSSNISKRLEALEKKVYGIDKPTKNDMSWEPFPLEFYYSCKNCGNKWIEIHKVYAVTGRSGKDYDFCSECYKEENE